MIRTEGSNNDNNMFTNGPPGTSIEENWLNSVQEEICYVIEQAGETVQTGGTDTRQQLYDAIAILIASSTLENYPGNLIITPQADNAYDLTIGTANNSWKEFNITAEDTITITTGSDKRIYIDAAALDLDTINTHLILNTGTPASKTATGIAGQIQWDSDYIYVCVDGVAPYEWKRVAISNLGW